MAKNQMSNYHEHPGYEVKQAIIKTVTIKEASEKLGIGRPALSNFLNGNSDLSNKLAFKLQKVFGIDAKSLIYKQKNYDLQKEGHMKHVENSYYDCPGCGYRITGLEKELAKADFRCVRCNKHTISWFRYACPIDSNKN